MAVDLKSLKNHPGLNPDYSRLMKARLSAQRENSNRRDQATKLGMNPSRIRLVPVPKQPNKYIPHIGAKQHGKRSK